MKLEVIGSLHEIFEEQQITPTFKKREFVLEIVDETPTGMTYTNYASFQLVNTGCSLIDNFQQGEKVKVSFNLRGNRWERDGVVRYITNLNAWRIERAEEVMNAGMPTQDPGYGDIPQAGPTSTASTPQFVNQPPRGLDDTTSADAPSDDLPF